MKTIISTLLCVTLFLSAFTQKEFSQLYSLKIPVPADYWSPSQDRSHVIAGDLAEICSIDAVAGKVLWTMRFKEKFGVKKCEEWNYLGDIGVLEIIVKGDKKDERRTILVDDKTGQEISEEAYRLKKEKPAKTKSSRKKGPTWSSKDGVWVEKPAVTLQLAYERPKINSSFQRDKKFGITVSCSGEYSWSTTVQGSFVRSLCDNTAGFGQDFGGDFISIQATEDVVFIQYEGLSVLDIKTGKLLWETSFDFSVFDFGVFKSEMIIGRAPMPVVDKDAVYVADLSKDVRKIRKFDLRTGKILWESEKVAKDAIITEMIVLQDMLVVKNGGEVNVQTLVTNQNGGSTCTSEYKNEGDFSLTAYSTSNGALAWDANRIKSLGDKFKSISNLNTDGTVLFVASDRSAFSLDPKTGNANWKADISKLKIGKPKEIALSGEDLIVDGDEGVARITQANGSVKYNTNTDKNLGWFVHGDVYYLWTGKKPEERNQFIRFNMENGQVEGMIKETPYPYFTGDGNEFIKKSGSVLSRYRTK